MEEAWGMAQKKSEKAQSVQESMSRLPAERRKNYIKQKEKKKLCFSNSKKPTGLTQSRGCNSESDCTEVGILGRKSTSFH